MSEFLPDNFGQQSQSSVNLTGTPSSESSQGDIALMQRVLTAAANNPNLMPENFMAYLFDWIQTQRLSIPIGQVFGFQQFTANFATEGNADSTSSTALGDCTNAGFEVGPQLSGLGDGKYVLLYGSLGAVSVAGNVAAMNIEFNGSSRGSVPQSGDAEARGTSFYSIASGQIVTLNSGGGNSIKAVYAVDNAAVTGSFGSRWLMALRYGNT